MFEVFAVAGTHKITSLGFQFLLLGRCEQVWAYLTYYFKFMEVTYGEVLPVLEFFLKLCLCVSPADSESLCCC